MNGLRRSALLIAGLALLPPAALAKVDLVTLPDRDGVQLTIYNSADLTYAKDRRSLTLREGGNRLQFSWAGTLIDPTSLELLPRGRVSGVVVEDLEFPARVTGLGVWNVASEAPGEVPMEISYFTSGIRWRAFYQAVLSEDQSTIALDGYVRVDNGSGEDYPGAETRLIVGKVNLLDRIADLARRDAPYGKPGYGPVERAAPMMAPQSAARPVIMEEGRAMLDMAAPKEIVKEGLSEYFLYTIEGTEDIADGWGKRLLSLRAAGVPVENLYRYDESRYGTWVQQFLAFVNDEVHKLGGEPLPGGQVMVFKKARRGSGVEFVGRRETRYIPKDGEVNLNLGPVRDVEVKVTPMAYATDNYEWRTRQPTGLSEIIGWEDIHTVRVEVANRRDVPATVEVRRDFNSPSWALVNEGDYGTYEKVDLDTVQYTLQLQPHTARTFTYRVTLNRGSRMQ